MSESKILVENEGVLPFLNSLEKREFLAFANGVTLAHVLQTEQISSETLLSEIFPEKQVDLQVIEDSVAAIASMLFRAVEASLSPQDFVEELLTLGLEQDAATNLATFWKKEGSKITTMLRQRTLWNNTIKKFRWRTDLQARARARPSRQFIENAQDSMTQGMGVEINESTAVFELNVGKRTSEASQSDIFLFEVNKSAAAQLLGALDAVESKFSS